MEDPRREVYVLSAPQIGKSAAVACWLLVFAWSHPGALCWWTAPTYAQTTQGYRLLKSLAESAGALARFTTSSSKMGLTLIQGAEIEFRSWERTENLSGPTVHAMVMDEAHLLTAEAYATLAARRSATLGPVRGIGNAGDVEGQFKALCDKAADPDNAAFMSFRKWTWRDKLAALHPDAAAAYAAFIDEQRRILPEWLFRGLYEAEWTANAAAVFRPDTVDRATSIPPAGPLAGARYVIGWDIAQSLDYTVGIPVPVPPAPRRITAMVRFHGVDYPLAARRIAEASRAWNNALNVIEVNGPGKPVFDELIRLGVPVSDWTTSNQTKHDAVIALSSELAGGSMRLADLPPLQTELKALRYKRNLSGTYSYGAPEGSHDDTVMSLAIGNFVASWSDPALQRVQRVRIA